MMSDPDPSSRSTLKRVARFTGVYIVAAAGVWQAADVAFEALGFPPRALSIVVIVALALLPLAPVAGWLTSPRSTQRMSDARRHRIVGLVATAAVIVAAAAVIIVVRMDDGPPEAPPDVALATIRETVFSGEIAAGQQLADRLAARTDVTREVKLEAYRHVARAALRAGDESVARSTVERMLDFEPPLVLLQPSVESPELIALYTAARRARVSSLEIRIDLDSAVFSVGPIAVIGIDPAEASALQEGMVNWGTTGLARSLKVVERSGEWAQSLVEVETDDPEAYYRVYDDLSAGRVPGILPETHAITGSVGVNGERVLVSLWAMDLQTGGVIGHGLAEGDWPASLFEVSDHAIEALVEDLKSRSSR